MTTGDATASLLDFVTNVSADEIPEGARTACRTYLLDSLGVAVAGTSAPWAEGLSGLQAQWGAGDDATNWVFGRRLPAPAAAFANAYQIHNSEYDCIHEAAVVHPMAVTLPALMAAAEREGGVTGRDFLSSLIIAVETACTIGTAATGGMQFFRPATAGAFGAVAGIGRLLGFDREILSNALGIVYGQLSGNMQAHTEGSVLLAMQIGFNARNAVVACDMARAGVPGLEDMLEGEFGYFSIIEQSHDLGAAIARLGDPWCITEVAHKPFPSGRATHGVLDALLELQRENGFGAGDIAAINAEIPPLTHQLVARTPQPGMTPNQARLCIGYVAARALQDGQLGVSDFTPEALHDAATIDLARKVSITKDNNPDPTALAPINASVTLTDGRQLEKTQTLIYGNPAKPMTREAHLEKFRSNWGSGAVSLPIANGEALIEQVDAIDNVADIGELLALIRA